MMTVLLAAALSFRAAPEGAPEFLAPEFEMKSVDAGDTPGSSEWYVPVDRLNLPVRWRITRNGQAVTNSSGGSRIEIPPAVGLWPNDEWNGVFVRDWYCGYDVGGADYVRIPDESDPDPRYFNLASPEMFNLTWNTHAGVTNYRYSATACRNDEYAVSSLYWGRKLFKPKSSRFDSIARSALLASYEAYYERLYYASQGQRNEWGTDWGKTSDPQRFNFNPTNGLVATTPRFHPYYPASYFESADEEALRPIPASHRLADADNIASLIYSVRDLFPMFVISEALEEGDSERWPSVLDARPFVFRPHWLTDQLDYPHGDRSGACLWWASTVPPPVSTQLVWGAALHDYVESTTIDLFPKIGNWQTVDELYDEGVPFSCYATTLDMLNAGDSFSPDSYFEYGPCFRLFLAVAIGCPGAYDGRLFAIEPFDAHGLTVPGFLTNAYPRAAASVPNRQDAYDRYVDVGTDTSTSRRTVPERLDLVNQLLSVMDRTIMIPSMHVVSTNEVHSWQYGCDYLGGESVIKVRWNGHSWDILSGLKEEYELTGSPKLTDVETNEVVNGIRASVSATHTESSGTSIWAVGDKEVPIGLTDDDEWDIPSRPSTNVVIFVEDSTGVGIWTQTGFGTYTMIGHAGHGNQGDYVPEFEFTNKPSVRVDRSYEARYPASAESIATALGPHQPGFEAGSRVGNCKYAILAAKTTDSLVFSPMWRSEVGSYNPGGLANILASFCENCRTAMNVDFKGGLTSPKSYISLPSTVRLVCGEVPSTAEGSCRITAIESDFVVEGTNIVYHFTLAVPGETVEARHTGTWSVEVSRPTYDVFHYEEHTFDSNMVEHVEDWHEFIGPMYAPTTPPDYYSYGTNVESRTTPDPIELVYTNSYPETVELTGQAVTNVTFEDTFDLYDLYVTNYWEVISYIYEYDHTRDTRETRYLGSEVYSVDVDPPDPVVSNTTTTVGLTVTNSLPEDAIEYHYESLGYEAEGEYVVVANKGGKVDLYKHSRNPLTGEETWERMDRPFVIGSYEYECNLSVPGVLKPDLSPDHDPFDESIYFRVMTQVDWLWNFMKLKKDDQ